MLTRKKLSQSLMLLWGGVVIFAGCVSLMMHPVSAHASSRTPVGTNHQNADGGTLHQISVVSWGPGRLDVLATASDHTLRHWWCNDSNCHNSGWSIDPPLPGFVAGNPSVVSWGPGRLDVFATLNGALQHWWCDGAGCDSAGWNGPVSWGGSFEENPVAVSWGSGRLDVFATDLNGALQHWWCDTSWCDDSSCHSSGCAGPTSWGGSLTSDASAVSWGPGRLDVFGTNGALQHWWCNGSDCNGFGSGAESLGGSFGGGDASAVSWGPGRLDVFAVSDDGTLQHCWYDGSNWWGKPVTLLVPSLANTQIPDPSAVSWQAGSLDAFAMGSDRTLQHWWNDGSGWVSDPPGSGGTLSAPPSAVSWAPGRLDAFAVGDDATLYHWWYSTDGSGWGGPESLGGSFPSFPSD